jgi:hypothetical protein
MNKSTSSGEPASSQRKSVGVFIVNKAIYGKFYMSKHGAYNKSCGKAHEYGTRAPILETS